jgi:hypothetical protein
MSKVELENFFNKMIDEIDLQKLLTDMIIEEVYGFIPAIPQVNDKLFDNKTTAIVKRQSTAIVKYNA